MIGQSPWRTSFEERSSDREVAGRHAVVRRGSTAGAVFFADFGHVLSLFFRDPDGLEAGVCVGNPDAVPGQINPPGTPSRRYHPAG